MFRSGNRPPTTKNLKKQSADPGFHGRNPFDSDSDADVKTKPARSSSDPDIIKMNQKTSPYEENEGSRTSAYSYPRSSAAKKEYENDFRDMGGFENQSVQELENYAVYKAEETTSTVNNCMKIAEDIREEGTRTLVTLHQQGEQITRTHVEAANIDQELSRGEKLLGSLGGMFSKTWKPKKTRAIKGPALVRDDSFKRKGSHLEQRERLGLSSTSSGGRSNPRQKYADEPTSALEKVEIEKAKQDDGLSDLSDLLGQLKGMAVDMGSEIERQNKALDHVYDDVDEINYRVKGANQRGRRLLGK